MKHHERNSFVLYFDSGKLFEKLDDAEAGRLIKALFDYETNGTIPELEPAADMAFTSIQLYLDRDAKAYEEKCQANAVNGRKGAEATSRRRMAANATDRRRPPPTATECRRPGGENGVRAAKTADNGNDTALENETDLESDTDTGDKETIPPASPQRGERFKPPTVDDVKEYCAEAGIHIDADSFVDFYASKGWMVGKAKMKDWKAAVRNWERRDREQGGNSNKNVFEEWRMA